MRKVLLALLLTAVGLGLLLSFKSRPATGTSALGGSALDGGGAGASSAPSASPSPASPGRTATASPGAAGKSGSFTGTAEDTRYGPVQVQATISNGKLTDVTVLQVPDHGGYEDQIVQVALPELRSEALAAQSARIDVVSGATYTSEGYAESLQSALDQAGM